jgi:hypothetical protein
MTTKFEITDTMVEAGCRAFVCHPHSTPGNWMQKQPMRAAITAALEASGLVEENARLREAASTIVQKSEAYKPEIKSPSDQYEDGFGDGLEAAALILILALNKDQTQ